jgi:glycosyltransferase involved in cell wall biosynthesis
MLSLCLAVRNEENNLHYSLDSSYDLVDEIIIIDGASTDSTVKIAKSYGGKVKVFREKHETMFHINKQKALDRASGDWILQLDADEELTSALKEEIKAVIGMDRAQLESYENSLVEKKLFLRHQRLVSEKTGSEDIGQGDYVAFYVPRLNFFLGRFLRYGGVYPDGAIRLVKKGQARFPCRDIHEVMAVDGRVGWLQNPLYHYDSPTFKRYLERNRRYVALMVKEMEKKAVTKTPANFIDYCLIKPLGWFFSTQLRHKGILDGWRGVVFSFYSALRFPKAYLAYLKKK